LEHKDSIGNTGHSSGDAEDVWQERASDTVNSTLPQTDPVHFLHPILPEQEGIAPSYEQKRRLLRKKRGTLRLALAMVVKVNHHSSKCRFLCCIALQMVRR